MENENSSIKTIDEVKSLLTQLPTVQYGANAIPNLTLGSYGNGQAGFDILKNAFNELDLSQALESSDLEKTIKKQKRERTELEKTHTNLKAILGENNGGNEGSLAHSILFDLQKQIDQLIARRDNLSEEIKANEIQEEKKIAAQKSKADLQKTEFDTRTLKLEDLYKSKQKSLEEKFRKEIADINQKTIFAENDASKKILSAESNANRRVKLINQFSDFLGETNKNMTLYFLVIFGLLTAAVIAISWSIPDLLEIYKSYDVFIKLQGVKITNWQIINYAFGILIIKLPWALCLSAVFTGMYSLLKGLLITYEKINQDKRNMSAIYAISGNVAQALNEYGIAVAEHDLEDEDTGGTFTAIRISSKSLEQKRENLRWNQIMNYFERMQQHKIESIPSEDPSKLKLVSDLLNKMIDKLPKT
jgi:hypothetical protein